jgi:hypothetical protein
MEYLFVECGSCGHYHRPEFAGDCRDNDNRFTTDQVEAEVGIDWGDWVLALEEQMKSSAPLERKPDVL